MAACWRPSSTGGASTWSWPAAANWGSTCSTWWSGSKTNAGQGSLWRSQHELLPVFKKGAGVPRQQCRARPVRALALECLALSRGIEPRFRLPARACQSIQRSSRAPCSRTRCLTSRNRDEIVLEPFAGSGSTLAGRRKRRPRLPRHRDRRTLLRSHHPPLAGDDRRGGDARGNRRDLRPRSKSAATQRRRRAMEKPPASPPGDFQVGYGRPPVQHAVQARPERQPEGPPEGTANRCRSLHARSFTSGARSKRRPDRNDQQIRGRRAQASTKRRWRATWVRPAWWWGC